MKHESFPVQGFEFMNEPATDDQKRIILDLMTRMGIPTAPNCINRAEAWPTPFSKWDAACMINGLKEQLGEPTHSTIACYTLTPSDVTTVNSGHLVSEHREKVKTELCDCPHCKRNRQETTVDEPCKLDYPQKPKP